MTLRRVLVSVLVLLALAIAGTAIWLNRSLDSIVRRTIEAEGRELLGTRVSVESVDLSLKSGEGVVRGLSVANPEGHPDGDALRFDVIRMRVDLRSLRADPIVVEELTADAFQVRYVMDAKGQANLDVLKRHSEAAAAARPASSAPERKVRIRKVVLTHGHVRADATAVGQPEVLAFDLGSVWINDAGGSSGAPPEQVGRTIVAALQREVGRAVAKQGLKGQVEKATGPLGEKLRGLLK